MKMIEFMKNFLRNRKEICDELGVSDKVFYCPYIDVDWYNKNEGDVK